MIEGVKEGGIENRKLGGRFGRFFYDNKNSLSYSTLHLLFDASASAPEVVSSIFMIYISLKRYIL